MDSAEKDEKRRPLIHETTSPTTPMRVDQPPVAAYPARVAGEGEGPPPRVQAPPAGDVGPPVERTMPTRTPEEAAGPSEVPHRGADAAAAEERYMTQQWEAEQRAKQQREKDQREQQQWEEEQQYEQEEREKQSRRPAAAERVAAVASKVGRVVHRTAEVATDVGNAVADAASAAEVSGGGRGREGSV